MPNLPISGLPAGNPLDGTELFAIVQDGVTKYTTAQNINYVTSNSYGLYNQTGQSTPITNTTTETSLLDGGVGTLSVPANGFTVGSAFRAMMTGVLSVNNNHTLRIRVKTGAVVLADTGAITMSGVTSKNFQLAIDFSINAIGGAGTAEIATAGLFTYRQNAASTVEGEIFSTINNTTFNTTVDNTLEVTAQWGTADTGDSIYSQIFTLVKTY